MLIILYVVQYREQKKVHRLEIYSAPQITVPHKYVEASF